MAVFEAGYKIDILLLYVDHVKLLAQFGLTQGLNFFKIVIFNKEVFLNECISGNSRLSN